MILNINKRELQEAVATVSRFAEKKSGAVSALSGIAIVAEKGEIKVRAVNLETGIDFKIEGTIKKEGAVALPANIFRDITSSFTSQGQVTLEYTGEVVTLTSGTGKSTLKTLPYEDVPELSKPENATTTFSIPGISFKGLIQTVVACASNSTIRPELASIMISSIGGTLKAVATDSFRLAEKKATVKGSIPSFTALIPAKNATDILQTIPDSDVEVSLNEHQCMVSWDKGVVTTRLVTVQYPDYTQIIPKTFAGVATVLRKDFETALKQTAVFSDSFQKVKIGFDTKEKKVTLSARNTDVGESSEPILASFTGESLELSFNHRYLQTPLQFIETDSITLSSAGIGRPLVIQGSGDTSYMYLVMPMNQ